MILKILKYLNNFISFDSTNLSNTLSVSSTDLSLILSDIFLFDSFIDSPKITKSETTLLLSGGEGSKVSEEITIIKDYSKKEVITKINNIQTTENIYRYLSDRFNYKLNANTWVNRIIDFKTKNFTQLSQFQNYFKEITLIPENIGSNNRPIDELQNLKVMLESLKEKSKEGLTDDEKSKLDKLRETRLKIKEIQTKIDSYQGSKKEKDEINTKLAKAESSKKGTEQKLESVKLLIDSKEKLMQDIARFPETIRDKNAAAEIHNYRVQKKEKIIKELESIKQGGSVRKVEKEEDPLSFFQGKIILLFVFISAFISLIFYLLSFEIKVLVIGLVSIIILLALFLLLNTLRGIEKIEAKNRKVDFVDGVKENKVTKEDKILVSHAWFNALMTELTSIEKMINERLNGKKYEELVKETKEYEDQTKELKTKLDSLTSVSMTSEEYYKNRREVDILKIEKENLEYPLKNIDTKVEDEIDSTNQKIAQLEKNEVKVENDNILSLPIIFINKSIALDEIKQEIENLKKLYQVVEFELKV